MPQAQTAQDIRDIKGLFALYGWYQPWIGFALLVVVLLGIGVWRWRHRKKSVHGPEVHPSAPPRPAHVVALERLEKLRAALDGSPKPFHFELSEALRFYVEGRYGIPATDRTSEELQIALPRLSALGEEQKLKLMQVLKHADQVKFTDFHPARETSRELLESARAFILETIPPEPQAGEGRAP